MRIGAGLARQLDEMPVDARGYVHPCSEEELCALVRTARARGAQLRVRGSAHSVPGAIHADRRLGVQGRDAIEVMLDRYAEVAFDDARRRVTVQAGCRFGRDPRDPTQRSSVETGLCAQLDRRGWALPCLGGVTHTTVAGFLAMGSAGGSVAHGLHESVVAIRIVDGNGEVHELSAETTPDLFHAAVVGMGLFGVVSTVTLQCIPRFDVIGSEAITTIAKAPFDVFGAGPRSLESFLRETPYARVLWWPQQGVDKLAIWQARRMTPSDYDDETGPPWAIVPRPYHAFDPMLGSTLPVQAAAGAALAALGGWRAALEHVAGSLGAAAARALEQAGLTRAKATLINAFVPEDARGPRRFWDTWWRVLPMDDEMDERLLPTTFTEIWLPLAKTGEALRRLRDLFARDARAAGDFAIEIYASGASPFWLSPSFGEAAVRLNLFWLARNAEDPRDEHFPKVWGALEDLGARLHWAKILPHDAHASAASLARRYPRWADFAKLRAEMDPDGVFLTSYWRAHLGLGERGGALPAAPLPQARAFDEPSESARRWPLLFSFKPADVSLLHHATHVIEARGYLPAPPAQVAHTLFFEASAGWFVAFVGIDWLTEPGVPDGSITDGTFLFMTIRGEVIEMRWPNVWRTRVLACSLPLATEMMEEIVLDPAPDGGTDMRWRMAYEVAPALAPMNALIKPLFLRLFQRSIDNLARYLGRPQRGRRTAGAPALRERA